MSKLDTLRGQINTLIYEVTDSDDVVKDLADLLVPFVSTEVAKAKKDGHIKELRHMVIKGYIPDNVAAFRIATLTAEVESNKEGVA